MHGRMESTMLSYCLQIAKKLIKLELNGNSFSLSDGKAKFNL